MSAIPGLVIPSGAPVSPGGLRGARGEDGYEGSDGPRGPTGPAGNVPVGCMIDFAGAVAPDGFLLCDGVSYQTSQYPELFAVIGYTYGGSGSTFQVPDARGRSLIGVGAGVGLTIRTLGAIGGSETHVLSVAQMPSHTHIQNPHSHSIYAYAGAPAGGTWHVMESTIKDDRVISTTATNQNTGGGEAHPIMPPFLVANKIIKY